MLSSLCMDVWSSHLCRIRHHISHHHHHHSPSYTCLVREPRASFKSPNYRYKFLRNLCDCDDCQAKSRSRWNDLHICINVCLLLLLFCLHSQRILFCVHPAQCIAFLIFKISSFFIWYFRDRVTGADHHTNEWMTLTHELRNAKHTDDKQSQNNK